MNSTHRLEGLTSDVIGWQQLPEFADHEFLMSLNDTTTGLRAFIGIHSTNLGPALGGTRFKTYSSETEAIADVLNLSHAMSYKCALSKLPYGGGKAVIMLDPNTEISRQDILAAYARLVDKLGGLFKTGTDVGISEDEVLGMAKHTAHMLGATPADRGDLSTSNTAALGVFYAMKPALKRLNGSDSFTGQLIAIKGVGKLGGELARLITEAGGSVVIADVNENQCQQLAATLRNVTVTSPDTIHTQEVIIYAPCALGAEFTHKTIPQLRCQAIVGGANNQLIDQAAGDQLAERGIIFATDFVANAGGLIYVADELEPGGFNQQRVRARTMAIEQTIAHIFEQSDQKQMPTHRMADQMAEDIIRGRV